jgi:hypothetical protein
VTYGRPEPSIEALVGALANQDRDVTVTIVYESDLFF